MSLNGLFGWLKLIFFGRPKPPVLEEARFPTDKMGRPDLTRFTRPVDHYIGYVDAYLTSLTPPPPGHPVPRESRDPPWQVYAYRKGVLGQWGLIARGPGEALTHVLTLLKHPLPEGRQAAAGVLEAWTQRGGNPDLGTHALAAAEREAADAEPDPEVLSVLLGILGQLRMRDALPLIARVLRADWAKTGDVDYSAAEAVAEFARESFGRDDPRGGAERWLLEQGF